MTRPRGSAPAPLAALALLGALALAGCGSDADEPDPAASSSPSSAAADPTSAEPSESASESPTESPSGSEEPTGSASVPSVAPATGPVMQLDDMSINAPEGWEVSITGPKNQAAFNASGGPGAMTVLLVGAVPGETFDFKLDSSLETMQGDGLKPQRRDDVTLDGVPAYVLEGSKKGIPLEVQIGGVAGGDTFNIAFQFLSEPPPDIWTTIDGVLASVVFDAA